MTDSTKTFYVYIMTNERNTTLYTGVTNDLEKRVAQHREKLDQSSFTAQYNINKLVYFEETEDINEAIAREKQIKGWVRERKVSLIESLNPEWKDLLGSV